MDKPGKLVWNLCLPFGEWAGHPTGPQSYGRAECAAIVAYFDETYRKFNRAMPIDYDHLTFESVPSEAAGWIWELALVEKYDKKYADDKETFVPGIYMANEWTPKAQDQIEGKQYKYLSPVVVSNAPDPITGREIPIQLFTVALTNVPFMLDKFDAVKASMEKHGFRLYTKENDHIILNTQTTVRNQMDPKEMLAKVKEALKLGAEAAGEEVLNLVKKLVEFAGMFPDEGGEMPEPEEMPAMAQNARVAMATTKALAAKFSCKPEELTAKIDAAIATAKNSKVDPDAELRNRVAELEADALISEFANRIPTADRPKWRDRAIKDAKYTRELLEERPVLMSNQIVNTPTKKTEDVTLTDAQLAVCKRLGVTPEAYKKTLASKPTNN